MECWGDKDTLISAIKRKAKGAERMGMLIHVGWPRKEGLSEEMPFEPRPACHFLGGNSQEGEEQILKLGGLNTAVRTKLDMQPALENKR